MTTEEAREALERLCDMGWMERQPDDTYKPTPLGRMIAKNSGGKS